MSPRQAFGAGLPTPPQFGSEAFAQGKRLGQETGRNVATGRNALRPWMLLCASAALLAGGCAAINTPAKESRERSQLARQAAKELDQGRETADMLAARERLQRGELPQACEILERVLIRNPDQAEAQKLLAENRAKPAGGAENADRAASSGKGDITQKGTVPFSPAADEALQRGDAEAAFAEMRKAGQSNPRDPQIPLAAAALLLRHNQTDAAARLLADSARQFPDCPAIQRMLGTAQYRLGDYQNAQLAFQQALSLDKSSALSYFLLGCTLAKVGQKEAAEANFQQAATLDPRYGVQR